MKVVANGARERRMFDAWISYNHKTDHKSPLVSAKPRDDLVEADNPVRLICDGYAFQQ